MKVGVLLGAISLAGFIVLAWYLQGRSVGADSIRAMSLYAWLCALIYLVVLSHRLSLQMKLMSSRKWPFVLGTIEDARVESDRWALSFSYRVNDTPYTGSVYSLAQPRPKSNLLAVHLVKKPQVSMPDILGRKVRVYYNPQSASMSVLSHAGEPSQVMMAIPTLVCSAAAFYVAVHILSGFGVI